MAPVASRNQRYAGSFRRSSQASSRGRKPPSSSRKRGRYRPSQRAQRTPLSNARASATPSVISTVTPSVSSTILTSGSRPWNNSHQPGLQFQGQLLLEESSVGRSAIQEVQDDSTFDIEAQIVMAIDIKSKDTVGCCYYVSDEQTLYLLEDITSGGNDMVEKLKVDINPTVVLVSTRADQSPTSYPSGDRSDLETETERQFALPYELEVRPCQEFELRRAVGKLVALQSSISEDGAKFFVPAESYVAGGNGDASEGLGLTDQQGKLLALSGFLNMDSHVTIGCVGALLIYLERKRSVMCTVGEQLGGNLLGIKSIEMLSLEGTMFINKDTLVSLQVIQAESHPNAFNQGPTRASSGSKESLSLYGLFQHLARTPQGKARLRQMFLQPSTDLEVLEQRQDFIAALLRPENDIALEKLSKSLRGVKNLRPVLVHLQKGLNSGNKFTGFKSGVWATLIEFAYHTIDIQETLRTVSGGENLTLLQKVLDKLDVVKLHHVGRAIHTTIDLTASSEEHRTVINPGIDTGLDNLKDVYSGLESLLSQVAIDIAETLPEHVSGDINVIYFPQLGFNIAIPLDEKGNAMYEGQEQDWEKVFVTENRAYYKDSRMHEMDEKLGDIYGHICEKEIEITYELAQQTLAYEAMLMEASDVCGELDSTLALTHGASLYKLTKPRMTTENIIDIKEGRHLLYEAAVPSFVPNDAFLVGGKGPRSSQASSQTSSSGRTAEGIGGPSMLLLTGPNYSGKSVYLKQVASIVLMAHVGSFVAAKQATIGLTDKILTRITTRETVSKMKSSFMLDLEQISIALNLATHRSLLVIDEFGKGTESSDGAGLACGLFQYLLELGGERPKVLGATHFHEIFESGFLSPRPEMALGHMEVQVDKEASELEAQIVYLYNFRLGRCNASFGTNCAAMNGIDAKIVQRAHELTMLSLRGEDLVAACAKMSASETRHLKEAERIARRFLKTNFGNTSQKCQNDDVISALNDILEVTDEDVEEADTSGLLTNDDSTCETSTMLLGDVSDTSVTPTGTASLPSKHVKVHRLNLGNDPFTMYPDCSSPIEED